MRDVKELQRRRRCWGFLLLPVAWITPSHADDTKRRRPGLGMALGQNSGTVPTECTPPWPFHDAAARTRDPEAPQHGGVATSDAGRCAKRVRATSPRRGYRLRRGRGPSSPLPVDSLTSQSKDVHSRG
eukprot:gene12574-biopygen12489